QVPVVSTFDNDREALLAVGGHGGRARLLGRTFGGRLEGRSQVETHFAVFAPVEPLAFGPRIEAEAPDAVDYFDDDEAATKGKDHRHRGRDQLHNDSGSSGTYSRYINRRQLVA